MRVWSTSHRGLRACSAALLATLFLLVRAVSAHDEPTSFLDLRSSPGGMEVVLTGSATDFAHDLPDVEPRMLLQRTLSQEQLDALSRNVLARLRIAVDEVALAGKLRSVEPLPEQEDIRLTFDFAAPSALGTIKLEAALFPYDPRHQTFANFYNGGQLERQEILEGARTSVEFRAGSRQGTGAVVRQFVLEGIHHIFIGPDHILFIIGLLLLGGTLKRLIKIVTAFTVAHSITLGLATFRLVSPPASLIEPVIALSIVFVGVHALIGSKTRDPRCCLPLGSA
jgi:hypothetical protein